MNHIDLTSEQLKTLFSYEPETGIFRWARKGRRTNIGDVVGSNLSSMGYPRLSIAGHYIFAHRAAWLYVYGHWPKKLIDHIDGNRQNNAISNLRDVTYSINAQNRRKADFDNQFGLLGVTKHKQSGRYQASLSLDGRFKYIGLFQTAEEAHQDYVEAKRALHLGCTI